MNIIILDTETANSMDDPMVYDIGYIVLNVETEEILASHSFVITDVFAHELEMMRSAYYAEKVPNYIVDLTEGRRQLAWLKDVRKMLAEDCKTYNVEAITAHNAIFDYKSCQKTQRYTTKSKYRWFFPYGIEMWDTLKMAREVYSKNEDYRDFCFQNGFVTKHKTPRPQLTAEVLYRYLTRDVDFVESHTGLEDVMIEKEILLACLRENPYVARKLWND